MRLNHISPRQPGFWSLMILAAALLAYAIHIMADSRPRLERIAPDNPPPSASIDDAPEVIAATGLIEPRSEIITLAPAIGGIVSEVRASPGEDVTQGQVLLRLDPAEAEAELHLARASRGVIEQELAEARIELRRTRSEAERAGKLRNGRILTEQEFSNREFDVQSAEAKARRIEARLRQAQAEIAKAEVRLAQHEIRAPIAGQLLQARVRAGEYLDPSTAQAQARLTVGDLRALHVRVEIDEADLPRFDPAATAQVSPRGRPGTRCPAVPVRTEWVAGPKKNLSGAVSERVDTRVLEAIYRLEITASIAWAIGSQVDVFIPMGNRP